MSKQKRYWHFAADDRKLRYGDGRIVMAGQTYTATGKLELCENGMHASERAIDALQYAPGAFVSLVTLDGEILTGDDKACARSRTVIACADATAVLFRFSIDCAARAMERCGWDHEASWNALAIREAHMQGIADDSDLSAAESAAWAAAWAAESAAESAARSAAWAAESAAWAAESAAWAAESAAWAAESAARSAERDIQNAELERRLRKLLKVAA